MSKPKPFIITAQPKPLTAREIIKEYSLSKRAIARVAAFIKRLR